MQLWVMTMSVRLGTRSAIAPAYNEKNQEGKPLAKLT